jgi:hypothetical protein
MRSKALILMLLILLSIPVFSQNLQKYPETYVKFSTTDTILQKIYDHGVTMEKENIAVMNGKKVLVEGAGYVNVWLETQPMGGYMWAKHDLELAKNNIEIFIDNQREDGRLSGVIYNRDGIAKPDYCHFQGLYLARPALELYFLLGRDKIFLQKVYSALEKFDYYLWKTRDSDDDGCLETWCIFENGEDHSVRFNGFPNAWAFEFPPTMEYARKLTSDERRKNCKQTEFDSTMEMTVPIESMDVMSYSYSCRDILSIISKELNTGKEEYWRKKADEVKNKIKSYLWDPEKNACFDRDKNNITMPILLHNNLRCMYFGDFDQEMADKFIKYHLLNPKEFWTPMPLPSIAANDPMFRNIPGNNWSGQPQGLTFQRSIQALENYGHFAELTMLGQTFLKVIGKSGRFTQQFDPFTTEVNNTKDGYGPSILATLEFISRFYGIHITQDKIYWSCIDSKNDYEYTQKWNNNIYTLKTNKNMVSCSINGKNIFSFSKGARIITDSDGEFLEVIGIEIEPEKITYTSNGISKSLTVEPNTRYRKNNNGDFIKYESVEFSKVSNK